MDAEYTRARGHAFAMIEGAWILSRATKSDTIDQQSFMIDEKNPERKEGKPLARQSSRSLLLPYNNSAQNVSRRPDDPRTKLAPKWSACVASARVCARAINLYFDTIFVRDGAFVDSQN